MFNREGHCIVYDNKDEQGNFLPFSIPLEEYIAHEIASNQENYFLVAHSPAHRRLNFGLNPNLLTDDLVSQLNTTFIEMANAMLPLLSRIPGKD